MLPSVAALCPTFGRPPHLLENTLACWEMQMYPAHRRHLYIYDDRGNIQVPNGANWSVHHRPGGRCPNLPRKYNEVLAMVDADIVVVWEDDDLYLPWHIEACVRTLREHAWAHPERVWSTYKKEGLITEPATGRFHASLAFRTHWLRNMGGWIETDRDDFDQLLLKHHEAHAPPGRPDQGMPPSYVFRWRDTGAAHGQDTMHRGPNNAPNTTWYRDHKPQHVLAVTELQTRLDPRGELVVRQILDKVGVPHGHVS